ncbi:MAG: hypothetical protein ACE5HP_12605 [Gemmatimonadota bacterium]
MAFGAVHAVPIVPVWSGLVRGLAVPLVAGPAVGWALEEVRSAGSLSLRFRDGLALGWLLWLCLVPMTAAGAVARMWGLRELIGHGWQTVGEVTIVIVTGGLGGWHLTRRRTGVVALATASLVLALVMGGPIPVNNSLRAAGLFLAFLPIYGVSGLLLVWTRARFERGRSASPNALGAEKGREGPRDI